MSETPIRILLVDDVRLFREIEKTFLQRSGYEILTATTGVEALEKAREYQPRLILLDCRMPVMDGIACCRRIKSDPELRGIKVIMVTTRGAEEDRKECIEAGCDGYLTKPVKRQEFLSCIEAALGVPARRADRLPISIKVSYSAGTIPEQRGVILNLSASGLLIVTEDPPPIRERSSPSRLSCPAWTSASTSRGRSSGARITSRPAPCLRAASASGTRLSTSIPPGRSKTSWRSASPRGFT